MGLVCDGGLPSSLSALVGMNHLGLSNNPDLVGPIPAAWSALAQRLSYCPSSSPSASAALPAPGGGGSGEFFLATGFFCGLDVRNTSLCGVYPGDLAPFATPSALPPCACSRRNASAPPTLSYSPLCVMLLGYRDFCLNKSKWDPQMLPEGKASANATNNYTLCPSPPPPSPPSPPSPPTPPAIVCVQPARLAPIELCVPHR